MPASASEIRKRNRVTVLLPTTGMEIEMHRFCGLQMLEAGIGSLILFRPDSDTAETDAAAYMAQARRIVCACSLHPRIVDGPAPTPDILSIDDLPEEDVIAAVRQVVEYYVGGYYGANRTTPLADSVIEQQMEVSYLIDTICQRYGLSPLEVETWDNAEIARVTAMIEAAEAVRERKREAAQSGK
jgi:hypothetical protein